MNSFFSPGEPWLDTNAEPIQAHGGALLAHDGAWYWYGEDKSAHTSPAVTTASGVSCYRSTDLLNWENLGLCLTTDPDPASPLHASRVIERPKVLFNAATGRFVLWLHLDSLDYTFARAGVAVADRPEGPFRLVRCQRSFRHDYGWPEPDPRHQREQGNAFLDFNLFLDDDGQAYVFHVSENLLTLYVSKLSADFTDFLRPAEFGVTWSRILVNRQREAPAPFKHKGAYYLFTSGCSGWTPNHTQLARAPHPFGPWEILGDPFVGAEAAHSHHTQPTAVVAAPGAPAGSFLFLANRWRAEELRDSRHVWLPFVVRDGAATLDYRPRWSPAIFTPRPAPGAPTLCGALRHGASVFHPVGIRLEWTPVSGADGYRVYADDVPLGFTVAAALDLPLPLPGVHLAYTVRAEALAGGYSPPSNAVTLGLGRSRPCHLSDHAPARASTGFGELVVDRAWDGEALRLGEQDHAKGLLAHADSDLLYLLGARYGRLTATLGIHAPRSRGEAIFIVEADGREVFSSGLRRAADDPLPLSLCLRGVRHLRLRTHSPATIDQAHAIWADIRLTPADASE